MARVLEGPVPAGRSSGRRAPAVGSPGTTYGLPRFAKATFEARFPFGKVPLTDPWLPLEVEITGWSPFEPGNADDSSLPVAALEYRFTNRAAADIEAVFSFNAKNFMADEKGPPELRAVRSARRRLHAVDGAPAGKPWEEGAFSATVSEPDVKVNHAWFRGDWWDALTLAWKDVERGACYDAPPPSSGLPSPGATLVRSASACRPAPRARLSCGWPGIAGTSNMRVGEDPFAWPWPAGARARPIVPGMRAGSPTSRA